MNNFEQLKKIVLPAFNETLYMVFFSSLFSIILGIVIGVILYVTEKDGILENKFLNKIFLICLSNKNIPYSSLNVAPIIKLLSE